MKIIKGNKEYNLRDYDIYVNSYTVSSPNPIHTREYINGKDGYIDIDTVYDGRTIDVTMTMDARDRHDFVLLRNEIFRIFDCREEFILVDEDEAKQWRVKYDSPFSMKRMVNMGEFNIKLISESPYSESIGTSLDSRTFDVELWGIGQGLSDQVDNYVHTTNEFVINNIGDVRIDPRDHPIVITYKGACSNPLVLRNESTGEEWRYNGTSNENDEIVIKGIRAFKNGSTIFKDTNYRIITLQPGENQFSLSGTVGEFTITFDTVFYYL